MKKIIAAVALILTAVFAVSCSGKKSDVPDGMKLASDPKSASYTLYVPEDWTVDVQNSSTRAYCSAARSRTAPIRARYCRRSRKP